LASNAGSLCRNTRESQAEKQEEQESGVRSQESEGSGGNPLRQICFLF